MTCCASLLHADKRTILGAIVAGGKSTRFGSDKAVARIGGRALIDHVADHMSGQCAETVVVGREHVGLRSLSDRPAAGMGPLGGIAAALEEAQRGGYAAVLSAPCDAYDLPDDLAQRLHPAPAYVESQPVIGLWPANAANKAMDILKGEGRHSMRAFADAIGARAVQLPSNPANINTAADLERADHGI